MNKGKLIVVSAPSGSGKTSIIKQIMELPHLNLSFSISATCRPPRNHEKDAIDYYFIDHEQFIQRVERGDFIEWEEVYPGVCYGSLKSEIERLTAMGKNVLFDVDVVGGLNIKKLYADNAKTIFIKPPSIDELRKRLELRNTDSAEVIDTRIAKAEKEISFSDKFDHIVVNDDLQTATKEVEALIDGFVNAKKR